LPLNKSPVVIASEAKQSRAKKESLDCFVASLLAMTAFANAAKISHSNFKQRRPLVTPSFRGAKRTRNLEILRCAIPHPSSMLTHRPGMTEIYDRARGAARPS
jgi:hypothetical protein